MSLSIIKKPSPKQGLFSPDFYDMFEHFPSADNFKKWVPKVDVIETNTAYEIIANIPGVPMENITLEHNNNYITISGQTTEEQEDSTTTWYRVERESGAFHRSFRLPDGINVEQITATAQDGTVHITLPKKQVADTTAKKAITIQKIDS